MQKRTEATRGSVSLLHKVIACILSIMLTMSYSSIAYAFDGEATDATTTEDTGTSDATTDESAEEAAASDEEEADKAASADEESARTDELALSLSIADTLAALSAGAEEAASTSIQTNSIQTFANAGAFTVATDKEEGTDWTYSSNVTAINAGHFTVTTVSISNGTGASYNETDKIIAITPGTYTIAKNCDCEDATDHSGYQIATLGNGTYDITLSNVMIDNSTLSSTGAMRIRTSNATVTLYLEGENSLSGGSGGAGIQIASGSSLIITTDSDSNGSLTATGGSGAAGIGGSNITISGGTVTAIGGSQAAGIGGGEYTSGSDITITGGTVTATGGTYGAGIGGGRALTSEKGNGSDIKISGGTVIATGGTNAAGIGGGYAGSGSDIKISGGTVTATGDGGAEDIGKGADSNVLQGSSSGIVISNGSVKATSKNISESLTDGSGNSVYLCEIPNMSGVNSVTVDSTTYTRNGNHDGDGTFYLYLTGEDHVIYADGAVYSAKWDGSSFTITEPPFTVTTDKTYGTDWVFESSAIVIKGTGEYTITGDGNEHSGYQIVIEGSPSVTLTIKDVKITNGSASPFDISNTANVALYLEGENSFTSTGTSSSSSYAGIQFADASEGASLTITSSTDGSLTATGGYDAAGIGGGYEQAGNYITITGGDITVIGGDGGAGIGGGYGGDAANIEISGGNVTATGYSHAAGIGGGNAGDATNIEISGGIVTATGGDRDGAGIGGGWRGSASNITISGGTVTAIGVNNGAGIGGGREGSASYIEITGGTVTATGGGTTNGGAGIGGGYNASASNITISGGTVTATAGSSSAQAIGRGESGSATSDISINYENGCYYRIRSGASFEYSANGSDVTTTRTYVQIYPADAIAASISFVSSSKSISYGETLDLSSSDYLTISPETYNVDNATWSSDDDCVAVDNSGTITGVSIGTANITVSVMTISGSTVSEATAQIEITVDKATPVASDFVFVAPPDTEYDGQPKEASVSVAAGIIGMGEITSVEYSSDNGASWSSMAPTDAGTYLVRITVDEGTNYTAATVESDEWTFTITDSSDDQGGTGGEEGGSGEGGGSGNEGDQGGTGGEEGGSGSGSDGSSGGSSGGGSSSEDGDDDDDEDASGTTKSGWTRLAGANRYATMVAVVQEAFDDDSSDSVVIASGQNFADSLTASSLAGVLDAPIILVSDSLTAEAIAQIERVGATSAYIVGGTASVSASVATQVANIAGIASVERVSGSDRYATAVAVAEKTVSLLAEQNETVDTVILASGTVYADALSISPYAYTTATPIILVGSDGMLDDASAEWIKSSGATSLIVAGGTASVADGAITQTGISSSDSERLAGSDRYATSVAIANWAIGNGDLSADGLVVASGTTFPDALAASALCGQFGSVLLLASDSSTTATSVISTYADSIAYAYFVGGTSSVSTTVANAFVTASKISLND